MRLAYLVSRFPTDAETFVLRELNGIAALPDFEVDLLSLFPPVEPLIHPSAKRWVDRPHRARVPGGWGALVWWAARRPMRLTSTTALVVAAYARRPIQLGKALFTLLLATAHARTLRRHGVEHVHAHFATYPTLAAWVCRRLTGVPYSFTAHAHDLFVAAERPLLTRKVRDARFVIAISEYNRRFLERFGGGRDTPVHVVHCGIDAGAYAFTPRRAPASGTVRALCVASLQEHKGHRFLFEALASENGSLGRLELDLVGGGDRRPLERLSQELGIADRVRFHGALPEQEVTAMLEQAHLFVLPSTVARDGQMEGISVALMEALASGLCVVASRLSGIPELVRDGETGVLAEPGNPASLIRALERAIDGCGGDWAKAGRRLVEAEFALDSSVQRLAELLRVSHGGATRCALSPAAPSGRRDGPSP